MKLEVTITIDGTDTAAQAAFAKFLNEIAGVKEPTALEVLKQREKATAPAADLAPEKPLKAEKKKAASPVKEEAPEPVAQLQQSPEPEIQTATAPTIDIVTLRKMVSERAANHRGAMREKLTELGAENVSSLPEEKYNDFHNFLLTLD